MGNQRRKAARRLGGLAIAFVVTNKQGAAQIQVEVMLSLKKHARFGLAAFTSFVPIMGAIINRINPSAGLFGFLDHLTMNIEQVILGHRFAVNSGLVGDDNDLESGVIEK